MSHLAASRRLARGLVASLALVGAAACQDDPVATDLEPDDTPSPSEPPGSPPASPPAAPPGASVSTTVVVPASMRTSPFNASRTLSVPPGVTIAVYARIPNARFMAVTPDGAVLVSRPDAGRVMLVRPNGTGDPLVTEYLTGLRRPHDMVFHTAGNTIYLYVAESHQVSRYVYAPGALAPGARQVVVAGLPDASSPELNGNYGHELKNIAIDVSGTLYVSIASTCNVCRSDTESTPVRASVYVYGADGSGGRLFARGLRNAEGLAVIPGTNTLWAVVNNRDNIAYPFDDGSGNYGRVFASYVDNHPPEAFTRVRDGGNYGWPFCNPNPDTPAGLVDMPFDRDHELNRTGAVDCASMDRINRGIQAHSAPLGLTFFQNTTVPEAYRQGVAVALHGSWNRTQKTGYKVVFFPWNTVARLPGDEIDLVRGWADAFSSWGRPVDVAVDPGGAILISDDQAGAIYRLVFGG